jgi:hypothetical protein
VNGLAVDLENNPLSFLDNAVRLQNSNQFSYHPLFSIMKWPSIVVSTNSGLRLGFTRGENFDLYFAPTQADGTILGFCGNGNGNASDDYTTREGEYIYGEPDYTWLKSESYKVFDPENPE